MSQELPTPRSTRHERNDERILSAARAVFVADSGAPIAEVAARAGIGMSALYRRFTSKEDLLRRLCTDGLALYIAAAERALADGGEPWGAFRRFVTEIVDADTHSLTVALAGTFTPTAEMFAAAEHAQRLNEALVARTREAGTLRADFQVTDLAFVLEQMAAVHGLGGSERTTQLRHRYLALHFDALRSPSDEPLPGPAPTPDELGRRWLPR